MRKKDIKALFVAIRKHENRTARALLAADPDLVNACASGPPKKDDGQSPLQVAFKTGNFAMARRLISLGADVHFMEKSDVNEWKAPVLHDAIRAAIFSQLDCRIHFVAPVMLVRRLLKRGADPNAVDSYGNTPLMRTLSDSRQVLFNPLGCPGFPDRISNRGLYRYLRGIISLLLKAGADVDAANQSGLSARDLAKEPGMAGLLRQRRAGRRTRPRTPSSFDELLHMDVALPDGPRLDESDCPVARGELRDYVALEACGCPQAEAEIKLRYARHARVGKVDYWLWFFTDEEGGECFAIVTRKAGRLGGTVMSTGSRRGLTADQIILGAHARVLSGPRSLQGPSREAVETGVAIVCVKPWGFALKGLVVTIDEDRYRASWGTNRYPAEPGEHKVSVHIDSFFPYEASCAGPVGIRVGAGSVARLVYRRPTTPWSWLGSRFRLEAMGSDLE